jgi:nucleotide-binding universal stress UspA family protein
MKPRKILAACELSSKASQTLHYTTNLASRLGAQLFIIHVLDARDISAIQQAYGRIFAAGNSEDLETYLHELRQDASDRLQSMIPAEFREKLRHRILIRQGVPHLIIVEEADRLNVDLLVVGEGRRGLLAERLVGTTAGHLLRQLSIPMISLRGVSERE